MAVWYAASTAAGRCAEDLLTDVPPMFASPPASNLIAFNGNVLTIPD